MMMNRVGRAAISGVRFSHSRRGMVARLTSFALSTDESAKSVLTRSRHATNPGGLQAQPAPVTKNPGFAGRHRFLHFVRLRGDDHRQCEGTGRRAVQGSVRAGSEYEHSANRNYVVPQI